MKSLTCTRCDTDMHFLARESLQLGQTDWLLGDLPNLLAGSLAVKIYVCPQCRRLEFFAAEDDTAAEDETAEEAGLPTITCPKCGTVHDFDYPRCPSCNHDYFAE